MGAFTQLGLLLWKYIILRKRQPFVLCLEILWPVLLFLVVVLVRRSAPPTQVDTCHFPERSMPTQGFDFIQSFVCNLNNECVPQDENGQPERPVGSEGTTQFLKVIDPLYKNRDKMKSMLNSIPTAGRMLNSIQDTLAKPEIKKLIEMKLTVGDFFRDPASLKDFLVDEHGMSEAAVDEVLASSFNMSKLYALGADLDFDAILCSPEELSQFLVFPSTVNVTKVAAELCAINNSYTADITNQLIKQLDIAAIIDLISDIQKAVGEDMTALALRDLSKMLRMLTSLDSVSSLLNSLPELQDLAQWMIKAVDYVAKLQSGYMDEISVFNSLLKDLEPLMASWFEDDNPIQDFSAVVGTFQSLMDFWTQLTEAQNAYPMMKDYLPMRPDITEALSLVLTPEQMQRVTEAEINTDKMTAVMQREQREQNVSLFCDEAGLADILDLEEDIMTSLCAARDEHIELDNLDHPSVFFNAEAIYAARTLRTSNMVAGMNWTALVEPIVGLSKMAQDNLNPVIPGFNFDIEAIWRNVQKIINMVEQGAPLEDSLNAARPLLYAVQPVADGDMKKTLLIMHLVIDMAEMTHKHLTGLSGEMIAFLEKHPAASDLSRDILTTTGPTTIQKLIMGVIDVDGLQDIIRVEEGQVVCERDRLKEHFQLSEDEMALLQDVVCTEEGQKMLEDLMEIFGVTELQEKVNEIVSIIGADPSTPLPPSHHNLTYSGVLLRYLDFTTLISLEAGQGGSALSLFFPLEDQERLQDLIRMTDEQAQAQAEFWTNLETRYINMIVGGLVEDLGKQLEQLEEFATIRPMILLMNETVVLMTQYNNVYRTIFSNDTIEGKLLLRLPAMIEGMTAALKDPAKKSRIMQILSQETAGVCSSDELIRLLNYPPYVPIYSFQEWLCGLNLTEMAAEYMAMFEVDHITRMLEILNGTDPYPGAPLSWTMLAQNVLNATEALMQQQQGIDIFQDYDTLGASIKEMFMMMADVNVNDLMSSVSTQGDMFAMIQQNMEPETIKMMDYYGYNINELMKVLTDAEGKLNMGDLLENSTTLNNMMKNAGVASSVLMGVMSEAMMDSTKMIETLMTKDLSAFCVDVGLKDLFEFPENSVTDEQIASLETMLCDVMTEDGMEKMREELMQDPLVQEIMLPMQRLMEYDPNFPVPPVNWTELNTRITVMVETLTGVAMSNDSGAEIMGMLLPPGVDVQEMERQANEMMNSMQQMTTEQWLQLSADMQRLLGMLGEKDPELGGTMADFDGSLAMIDSVLVMMNEELRNMIATGGSSNPLESVEMQKLISLMEKSPQVIDVLLASMLTYIQDAQKVNQLTSAINENPNFAHDLCHDINVFEQVFTRPNSSVDMVEVQRVVCDVGYFNLTMALLELGSQAGSTSHLIEKVTALLQNGTVPKSDQPFNMSLFLQHFMETQALMTELFNSSTVPTVDFMDMSWIEAAIWEELEERYGYEYGNLFGEFYEFETRMDSITRVLQQMVQSMSMIFPGQDRILSGYLNAVLQASSTALKQQQAQNLSLEAVFKDSAEASQLVGYLKDLPVAYDVLMMTVMQRPQIVSELSTLSGVEELCSRDPHDVFVIPAEHSSTFTAMFAGLCQLNVTVLTHDLISILGLQDVVSGSTPPAVSPAELEASLLEFVSLLNSMSTAELGWGDDFSWITDYDYTKVLEPWMQLSNQTLQETIGQVVGQLVGSLGGSLGSNFDTTVLQQTLMAAERAFELLDPSSLKKYPEMQKLFNLPSVDVIEAAILTLVSQDKMSKLSAVLMADPMSACQQSAWQDPVIKSLCAVNFTALIEEATQLGMYIAQPFLEPNSMESLDIVTLYSRMLSLTNSITLLAGSSEEFTQKWMTAFSWLDQNTWMNFAESLSGKLAEMGSTSIEDYVQYFEILEQFVASEAGKSLATPLYITNNVLTLLLHRLDNVNVSAIELAAMFPDSPEMQKLATSVEDLPYIIEILLYSYETPQFGALIKMNFTEALISLCHPLNDITTYLTIPERQSLASVNRMKDEFCQVDFMMLEAEYNALAAKIMQESGPVNLSATVLLWNEVQTRLSTTQLGTDSALGNGTVWLQILTAYAAYTQQMSSPTQGLGSYLQTMEALKTALGEDSEIYLMVSKFVEVSLSSMDFLEVLGKQNLTLYDLLSGQPMLMELVRESVEKFPDALEASLNVLVKNPTKLMELFGSDWNLDSFLQNVCTMTKDQIMELFEVQDVESIEVIRDMQCKIAQSNDTVTVLTNELLKWTTVGPYIDIITKYIETGDKGLLQRELNDTELAAKVSELIENLQKLNGVSNIKLPEIDTDRLVTIFEELYSQVDPNDMNTILPLVMSSLAPIFGSEEIRSTFMQYSEAMVLVLDYVSDITSSLDIKNGTLELSGLLTGGAESWKELLEGSLALQPQMATLLMGASIRLEKLSDLLHLSESEVAELLCSEEKMREFFILPPDLKLADLLVATCGVNATVLVQEFEQHFGINKLIEQVTAAIQNPTSSLEPEELVARFTRLAEDLGRLLNVSMVTFQQRDLLAMFSLPDLSGLENATLYETLLGFAGGVEKGEVDQLAQILSSIEQGFASSEWWLAVKAQILSWQYLVEILDGKIAELPTVNLSLRGILKDTDQLSSYLENTFSWTPEIVELLMNAQINTAMLTDNVTMEAICAAVFKDASTELYKQQCETNFEAIWEEIQGLLDIKAIEKQLVYFMSNHTDEPVDWHAVLSSFTSLSKNAENWLTEISKANISVPVFMNYAGDYDAWLERLAAAVNTPTTVDEETLVWLGDWLQQQMQDPLTKGYFQTILPTLVGMEMIIDTVNGQLPQPPVNLTLATLFNNQPATQEYLAELFAEFPDVLNYAMQSQVDWEQFPLEDFLLARTVRDLLCDPRVVGPEGTLPESECQNSTGAVQRELMDMLDVDAMAKLFGAEATEEMVKNFNWTRYLMKYQSFVEQFTELWTTSDVSLTQFFLYKGTLAEWISRIEQQQPGAEFNTQQILQLIQSSVLPLFDIPGTEEAGRILTSAARIITSKLEPFVQGDASVINLNILFPNVTRLQELLTEASKLSPETVQQILNQDTLQQLIQVWIEGGASEASVCDPETMTPDLRPLLQQLCDLNVTSLFWEIVQHEMDVAGFVDASLPGDRPAFDSSELMREINRVMQLLEDVMDSPPRVDDRLLSMFNVTHLLDMMLSMGQEDIMEQVVSGIKSTIEMVMEDGDPNLYYLYEVMALFDGELQKIVGGNMDLTDPSDLQQIFMDVLMFYSRGLIDITDDVGRQKYFRALTEMVLTEDHHNLTCNVALIEAIFLRYPQQLDYGELSAVLCDAPVEEWYERVLAMPHGRMQVYYVGMELFNFYSKVVLPDDVNLGKVSAFFAPNTTTAAFSAQIDRMLASINQLTNMTSMLSGDEKQVWEMIDAMLKAMQNTSVTIALETLEMFDYEFSESSIWRSLQSVGVAATYVMHYLNTQVNMLAASGGAVPLTSLLPDLKAAEESLGKLLSPDAIDTLLHTSLNPQLLMNPDGLEQVLCNVTLFRELFDDDSITTDIQEELCKVGASGNLSGLLGSLDMGKLVEQIQTMIETLNSNQGLESPWQTLRQQVETFIANLNVIMAKEQQGNTTIDTGAGQWNVLLDGLMQSFSNMTAQRFDAACNSGLEALIGAGGEQVAMETLRAIHVTVVTALEFVGSLRGDSSELCDLMNSSIFEMLTKLQKSAPWIAVTKGIAASERNDTVQCMDVMMLVDTLVRQLTETPMTGLGECANHTGMPQALGEIDQLIAILQEGQKLINDLPDLGGLGSVDPMKYVDIIINSLLQQKPNLLTLEALLKNNTDFMSFLRSIPTLSPDLLATVLDATLATNLEELAKLDDEALLAMICDPAELSKLLNLPANTVNISSLSNALCREQNMTAYLKAIRENIDLGQLFWQLTQQPVGPALDLGAYQKLLADIDTLIKRTVGLLGLVDFQEGFDISSLLQSLPDLQQMLKDNEPKAIVEDLQRILDQVADLIPDQQIMNDLQILLDGIKSLEVLNPFMSLTSRLSDVIRNPSELYNFLVGEVGLSYTVARDILESSLSYGNMLNMTTVDVEDLVCSDLDSLLIFTSNISAKAVSEELCAFGNDTKKLTAVLTYVVQQVEMGSILQQMFSIDPDSILQQSNITQEDVYDMVSNFSPLKDSFTQLFSEANNLTAFLDIGGSSDSQTMSQSMQSLSKVVCGRPNAFAFEDTFGLSDGGISPSDDNEATEERRKRRDAGNREKREAGKKREKRHGDDGKWPSYMVKEMSKFNTKFCRDMYKDLRRQENGQLMWVFIKPLLLGKIPFSPNTPVTRAIMEGATKVFEDVDNIRKFAEMWEESLLSMQSLDDSAEAIDSIQSSLESPLVKQMMTDMLGGTDVTAFMSQLEGLVDMSSNGQLDSIANLAGLIGDVAACVRRDRLEAFSSEEMMERRAQQLSDEYEMLAAVVFPDEFGKNSTGPVELPKHIRYKIRMDIDNVRPSNVLKQMYWWPGPEANFAADLRYMRGFVQLQDMIDQAVIHLQTDIGDNMPKVTLQQMPYPCYEFDNFQLYVSSYFFPVIMTLAWLVVVASSIRNIVYDKEHRLEETMKVMGLRSGIHWLAWFLNTFLGMVIMSIVIILFLKLGNLMRFSDPIVLFVYLADFSFATTMMCYLISVFFNRTTLAALVGVLIYLISYLPYVIVITMDTQLEFWHKILIYLFPSSALADGAYTFALYESRGQGVQWDNINEDRIFKQTPMATVLYMMAADGVLFGILGWYINNLFPGKYGVGQPWYFPVSPAYWGCCQNMKNKKRYSANTSISDDSEASTSAEARNTIYEHRGPGEADPKDLPIGISIHQLEKVFKEGRVRALGGLSVNFYQNQITAFLGQNGAGKTTTINLLTGIYEPTKGTAYVNGRSILTDFSSIRQDLGVCPQFDVLFDYMTVYEHLEFYAKLKSSKSRKQIKEEINQMLLSTGLAPSMHVKASELSGGQRRRLSVALAFVGHSKVVILDEPTSGVDPAARRQIWQLIANNRQGRTIIMCTHHLDEADILGDRIVMLHQGNLVCTGSPMFMKTEYGSGYHLTTARADTNPGSDVESGVLSLLQRYIPGARQVEALGREVKYVLPTKKDEENADASLVQLFTALDQNMQQLGLDSYGVSDTTLEEVFLKLTKQAERGQAVDSHRVNNAFEENQNDNDEEIDVPPAIDRPLIGSTTVTGASLKYQQLKALLIKRFHHHKRDVRSYLSQIILPCLFICMAMGFSMIKPRTEHMPSLRLSTDLYDDYSFYSVEEPLEMNLKMRDTMFQHPYLGSTCMKDSELSEQLCTTPSRWYYPEGYDPTKPEVITGECSCSTGQQVCPDGARGSERPYFMTPANDMLLNATGVEGSVDDYLVRTHSENVLQRYGGWSFTADENDRNGSKVKVWFNNKGWHAMTAYYNALSNMILRTAVNGSGEAAEYGITAYNHPLNMTQEQLSQNTLIQGIADTGIALCILCAFCFVPAGYTIYLINERINKEKRLQIICGVGPFLYWFTAYIWDMMSYLFTVGLAIGIAAAFQIDIYNARQNLQAFATILILFGWASIPLMYMMVGAFRDTSTGYMAMFLVNLIIGVTTTACIFLLSLFTYIKVIDLSHFYLSKIFLIFPQFCLGDSLVRLSSNQLIATVYERFNMDRYTWPFSFELIGWHLVAMAVEGAVFFLITLMLDHRISPSSAIKNKIKGDYREDDDVGLERQRVETGEARSELLVLHYLRKLYKRGLKKVVAVENVSVGIPKGECFGLLGENGAGKTTTFNMITGEVVPTAGVAVLNSKIISGNEGNMNQNVGYCPQFDALDGFLTGKEMLYCYGRLRGIPYEQLREVSEAALSRLGLEAFSHKTVRSYSGGTKRKLSTALALLGEPELVLMDEPTTGMDPRTRRLVWANITSVLRSGRSVVLTSHSMNECDALCTRMAIMVNGRFQCLGSSQHLKNKFGTGYTLKVRVGNSSPQHGDPQARVVSGLQQRFPGGAVRLQSSHRHVMTFQLAAAVTVRDVFSYMEREKHNLQLTDYSLSQTTLDQVFLSFVSAQTDGVVEEEEEEAAIEERTGYTNQAYESFGNAPRGSLRFSSLPSEKKVEIHEAGAVVEETQSPNDVVVRL